MELTPVSSLDTDLSNPSGEGEGGSVTQKHRDRLQKYHKDLLDTITLRYLLPDLHEKDVISWPEYRDFNNLIDAGKESAATKEFLISLNYRRFADFYSFCESLIIAGRAPWLTHKLMEDEDWKTLNRFREERMKNDHWREYFPIPPCVTVEQLRAIENEMKRGMDDIGDFWEQTAVKQGASCTQGASNEPMDMSRSPEGCVYPIEESMDETAPKEILTDNDDAESVQAEGIEEDDRPDWVRKLRKYQVELARPGVRGLNYIITAPTGSGKTHVAAYVIYQHLRKYGESARVVFFCPEVELVKQQYEKLQEKFEDYEVDYLVGSEAADKISIEEMLKAYQIIVVTPAIVDNALASGKISGLDAATLMIFDECHHTDGEHAYNKVMSKYLDAKLKRNRNIKLPQIIGMTASLGVGKARGEDDAMSHVLKMCSNMDASQIAVVRKHTAELEKYTNNPSEHTHRVSERSHDNFQELVNNVMKEIEEKIAQTLSTGKKGLFFDFPEKKYTQIYRTVLADTKNKLRDRPEDRLIVLPCLEYLMAYSWCLEMHRVARPQDAVMMLKRKLDTRPRGKVDSESQPEIEQWLEGILKELVPKLNALCEDGTTANPRLVYMKKVIMDAFREKPDSRCIIFTKTRVSTEALKSWINEDVEMGSEGLALNAERITGRVSEQQFGITSSKQDQILQNFKDGCHKILMATSVAEEGLDIPECNIIIRYNYTTNEVGRVQTKGRARDMNSKIENVDSEDHVAENQAKAKLNLRREGLMISAVQKIHEMNQKEYWDFVYRFQLTEYRNRYFRRILKEAQEKKKNKDRLILACFSCSKHMCYSDEIVKFQDTSVWYMCKNPEFDSLIKVEKDDKRTKPFDNFQKQYKVCCSNQKCRWIIGDIFEYNKQVRFPALKGKACHFFKVKADGSRGDKVGKIKKWDDTPYRYEVITEKELLEIFKGRVYEPE